MTSEKSNLIVKKTRELLKEMHLFFLGKDNFKAQCHMK